ncbi:MAG: hypothetical protein J4F28_02485 [Nitrosopumilaceae archaeon]|nr:hypothetical protein [Nitrosopumilaceae archaeon]
MVDVAVPQEDKMIKDLEKQILIGRSGLFNKYKITFDEASKTISLIRHTNLQTSHYRP